MREDQRLSLLDIDRATPWVFIQIEPNETAAAPLSPWSPSSMGGRHGFRNILSDHGKGFPDRVSPLVKSHPADSTGARAQQGASPIGSPTRAKGRVERSAGRQEVLPCYPDRPDLLLMT